MELSPRQRFALQEMGIPVWELREESLVQTVPEEYISEPVSDKQADNNLLQGKGCLVVVDEQYSSNREAQRLLDLMLVVTGIPQTSVQILTEDEFDSFMQQPLSDNKPQLLLLFGDTYAQRWISDYQTIDQHLGKICQVVNSEAPAFVCESLSDMLNEPDKKYGSWLSLIAAKEHFQPLS